MMDGVLSRPLAERFVETAAAAPSIHNAQPWRFVARLADRAIDIYADPARTLRGGDPRGRAVHIACGAALFNLRLAVSHAGAEPVTRLLPDPRNPLLLASVRVAGPRRPRPNERDLHSAIPFVHSRRPSPTARATTRGVVAALLEAAALEGASLRICDRAEAMRMLQSLARTDRALRADPAYLAELREFSPGPPGQPTQPILEGGAQMAVLSTPADDRPSWLRAGQALQRVMLFAVHRGLEASPVMPVLEGPDALPRPDPRHGAEYAEMIVRLGHGPSLPASRRPISQVLRVISPVPAHRDAGQDEGPRPVPPPALPSQYRELMPST